MESQSERKLRTRAKLDNNVYLLYRAVLLRQKDSCFALYTEKESNKMKNQGNMFQIKKQDKSPDGLMRWR